MYTEIYFDKEDPEIVEYFEEYQKAVEYEHAVINGDDPLPDVPNWEVLTQWYSQPVPVYETGAADGETPDHTYIVLISDAQYEARKALYDATFEDPTEDPDKEKKEKLKAKQGKMKEAKSEDKTFKKLEARWKRADGGPLVVFGPKGRTQDAPEERETEIEE